MLERAEILCEQLQNAFEKHSAEMRDAVFKSSPQMLISDNQDNAAKSKSKKKITGATVTFKVTKGPHLGQIQAKLCVPKIYNSPDLLHLPDLLRGLNSV